MPVTNVTHDFDTLSITITADFDATVEKLWQIYADPRKLEQIWGPPTHPATFVEHELTPGGRMKYFMTGPEGDRYHGVWDIRDVEEGTSFRFRDSFADEHFSVTDSLPVSDNHFEFASTADGARLTATSVYESAEALRQILDMGVEEGATAAMNQIDGLLAD